MRAMQNVSYYKVIRKKVELNNTNNKMMNHFNRATAVSNLFQHGVEEQQLIKITYLQLNGNHHSNIIKKN